MFPVGNLWKVESCLGTLSGVKELAKDENTENNTGPQDIVFSSFRLISIF